MGKIIYLKVINLLSKKMLTFYHDRNNKKNEIVK